MTMETLVFVADHRNRCHGRVRSSGPARFRSFSSKNFRSINCRTFQSIARAKSPPQTVHSAPMAKGATLLSSSPAVPASSSSPSSRSPYGALSPSCNSCPVAKTCFKVDIEGSPIPVTENIYKNQKPLTEELTVETRSLSYSELWAGPAYSNSPPPSSLPMPKFSLRSKRTVSLNLPASKQMVEIPLAAKSAPTSPTWGHNPSANELLLTSDCATRTLRRILNLDDPDD